MSEDDRRDERGAAQGDGAVRVRPYDPTAEADRRGLWAQKRAFETGLGQTGDADKAAAYEAKLDAEYRARYLSWVADCVAEEPGTVRLAVAADPDADADTGSGFGSGTPAAAVVGYVFVLPESMAMVWDAAVLNEIHVAPAHRGTGVADRLLRAGLEHARDQTLPLDRIVLDVDGANERARAFYERHGFERWGEMVAREL